MFHPANRPVSRPRVSQVDTDRMSDRLTAGLRAIQERDRNHDALVLRADAALAAMGAPEEPVTVRTATPYACYRTPSRLVEPLRAITTEDVDRMLCI